MFEKILESTSLKDKFPRQDAPSPLPTGTIHIKPSGREKTETPGSQRFQGSLPFFGHTSVPNKHVFALLRFVFLVGHVAKDMTDTGTARRQALARRLFELEGKRALTRNGGRERARTAFEACLSASLFIRVK